MPRAGLGPVQGKVPPQSSPSEDWGNSGKVDIQKGEVHKEFYTEPSLHLIGSSAERSLVSSGQARRQFIGIGWVLWEGLCLLSRQGCTSEPSGRSAGFRPDCGCHR